MPTYTDSFNRSGTIAPGSTETGGGTWAYSGSGSAQANGASAVLNLSGGFLYLDTGFGDVDVSADMQSQGTLTARAGTTDNRCFRARMTAESFSSGGYVSRPKYAARYTHPACYETDSYEYQCDNSSFPASNQIQCYDKNLSAFINTTRYLASVTQSGTCQVYQSSNYTVYSVTFEAVNSDGSITNLGSRQVNYQANVRIVASSTTVQCYIDGTLLGQTTDADATRRANGRHGLTGYAVADAFSLTVLNNAPNAPLLTTPVNGAAVDRAGYTIFQWQFSDADANDVQSKAEVEITAAFPGGGGSTGLANAPGSQQYALVGPNAYPAGTVITWRVRTYDGQGVQGPWSNSQTFTIRDVPPAPVLTKPVQGTQTTIPTREFVVAWTASVQDAYEVRRTANVDNPTPAEVYQTVTGAATRSAFLLFDVNSRAERVWVRVRKDGLWSDYSAAPVTVSYTPPPVPSVVTTANSATASIEVAVTCPLPTGTQPQAVRFDLFRTAVRGGRLGGVKEERVYAGGTPVQGGSVKWRDYTPASGVTYSYRAQVYGANGTAISS